MNKRELLDRCARDGEERVLLARVLDKLELSQNRGIPAHTPFLSPGEQASVQDLLNAWGHPRCVWTGGYEGAERQVCRFLPDWQEPEDALADPEGPLRCHGDPLHRIHQILLQLHDRPGDHGPQPG
mgnify:CR=1 FL=1